MRLDRGLALLCVGLLLGAALGFVTSSILNDDGPSGHHHVANHKSGGHSHDGFVELGSSEAQPTLSITAHRDPDSGWNIHLETTQFEFSALNAGKEHVSGEGHIHLYLNGEKWGRVYGNWVHIGDIKTPQATLQAVLYSNDHRTLRVNGQEVSAQTVLTHE